MKVVGLVSGGKDSIYNLMECKRHGHTIVAMANLHPAEDQTDVHQDELDSYMFQTVGYSGIPLMAQACNLPLFRRVTKGQRAVSSLSYGSHIDSIDEVEDLFQLLHSVVKAMPEINAVSSGAILSNYQRIRVENVCSRLGLVSLSYLWRADQRNLLDSMINSGLTAILIKTATMGLEPRLHLGKTLQEMRPHLVHLADTYQVNECGEGGEYESFVLDCPLFSSRIEVVDSVLLGDDLDSPITASGYMRLKELRLVPKSREGCHGNTERDMDMGIQSSLTSSRNGFSQFCGASQGYSSFDEFVKDFSSHSHSYDNEISLNEAVSISLSISDMSSFHSLNKEYISHFSTNPPTRSCVQVPFPSQSVFQSQLYADILTYKGSLPISYLHVQSISHWAPACLGPYSQSCSIGSHIFLAGMIGLDAPTMGWLAQDLMQPVNQTRKALLHVDAVLKVMQSDISRMTAGLVYIQELVECAVVQHEMEISGYGDIPLLYIGVPRLPKDALVELQMYALKSGMELPEKGLELEYCEGMEIVRYTTPDKSHCHTMSGVYDLGVGSDGISDMDMINCLRGLVNMEDIVFTRIYHVNDPLSTSFLSALKGYFPQLSFSLVPVSFLYLNNKKCSLALHSLSIQSFQ